jgi:hypothetical protein
VHVSRRYPPRERRTKVAGIDGACPAFERLHLDIDAMRDDMTSVSAKSSRLDLPPELATLRTRAYANLHLMLVACYFEQRRIWRGPCTC